MARLRTVFFWLHLTAGATAGLIILIMSVTGVLLTYEKQMLLWADTSQYRAAPAPGQQRLPIAALIDEARKAHRDAEPTAVTLRSDRAAPAAVTLGQRMVYVNPYTGEIWGTGSPRVRQFFRQVTDWHRWLGASATARPTGRGLTGASNLLFLFIVCSGLFLWWPRVRTWRQIRNVLWFRRGLNSKARDFNWHNTIGFWCSIPLVVIVSSAAVISYPWASNLVYRIAGEQPPAAPNRPSPDAASRSAQSVHIPPGLDGLWTSAERQVTGWQTITARLPASAKAPVVFTIDLGNGGQPQKRGTLTLDAATGQVIRWESFQDLSRGRRARSWLRFAHTGEAAGIAGQTIAGIASLGGAVLVWTGLALAWRRLLGAVRRARARRVEAVSTEIFSE